MIITRANGKIITTYAPQDPIDISLDYWYIHSADQVVCIAQSDKGDITVTVPYLALETGKVAVPTDVECGLLCPLNDFILYDCATKETIYEDKKGSMFQKWGTLPPLNDDPKKDPSTYLAGDMFGNFLMFSGRRDETSLYYRSLVLACFAQCKPFFLRDPAPTKQTEFGMRLATNLILKRWGLPMINDVVTLKSLKCTSNKEDLPIECLSSLLSISNTITSTVLAKTKEEDKTKDPIDSDSSIDLDILLELGISGFENDSSYPMIINWQPYFKAHPTQSVSGHMLHDVADVFVEMHMVDFETVSINVLCKSPKVEEVIREMFTGYHVVIKSEVSTTYIDLTEAKKKANKEGPFQ